MKNLITCLSFLLFSSLVFAQQNPGTQGLPEGYRTREYRPQSASSSSGYGLKLGVNQTAPGVLVENTDKDSLGHIQSEVDYGAIFGIYSVPGKNEWISFYIHLDYYTFLMDRQVVNNTIPMDLGSEVQGTAIELIPGACAKYKVFPPI